MRSWFPGYKMVRACRGTSAVALILLYIYAPGGRAEIYRCSTPDGGTLFSDKVCGEDAMIMEGKPTTRAPDGHPLAPPSQASPGKPKRAVRAATVPAPHGPERGTLPAAASAATPALAAAPSRSQGDDSQSEIANLAYLRAMGEQCPLSVEHTQLLRFLDMLAIDHLASHGIRLTNEETKTLAARARERAQHDMATTRQSACASADRRLALLGQTRVHFQVLSQPAKPRDTQAPSKNSAAPSDTCLAAVNPCRKSSEAAPQRPS